MTVDQFIVRLFIENRTPWWSNLSAETRKSKYGASARFLVETLKDELFDVKEYRGSGRQLFYFSDSHRSTIDGRFRNIGVEEKFNPLDIKEHLIDGAIHRGLVWVLGNPQNIREPSLEAATLYVVRHGSVPISAQVTDLFFPVLTAVWKVGVNVIFVNGDTGEFWHVTPDFNKMSLPGWLSEKSQPTKWDRDLEKMMDHNWTALRVLADKANLERCQKKVVYFPEFGGSTGGFIEILIDGTTKAAIIDYGNEWRLLELGLLLRSMGYAAVKVVYNSMKHKNTESKNKPLIPADRRVEQRVKDAMQGRFAVLIDWGVEV
jgi:hypothetical protein